MVSSPETHCERFNRVSKEQKASLVVSPDGFRYDREGVYSIENDMLFIGSSMALSLLRELAPTVGLVVALAGAPGSGKSTWIGRNRRPGVLYWDSTLTRRKERREVCEAANSVGTRIECLLLQVPVDVCLERNRARTPDRRVPEDKVREMHHRLAVCPPALDEGWDKVVVSSWPLEGPCLV